DDWQEQENSKVWVKSKTCVAWQNGFLCVDGTPFNIFQKLGWQGEGFFDRKSCYSLSNQVRSSSFLNYWELRKSYQIVISPHNLRIVDYTIGIPGSLHDSSTFQWTCIA
ncbi:hypothetical protein PAXRUDRAFT_147731, partial [Paxillus rubicundulus Ve08.2h10]